jgi:predicted secreted protein
VKPWNPATQVTLAPGESKTYGLKFVTSDAIRNIEKTLVENARPVAAGIPGYVLPMDMEGRLFLKYPKAVKSTKVEPAGAMTIKEEGGTAAGWKKYAVQGKTWGRARLTVTYADGVVQTIHYFVTKPEAQAVADMGHFLTTKQWFTDPNDPFHRSPSIMSYDRETNQMVMQDSRAWIAGLGDEGGGGAWLATIMKQLGQPNKEELDKFQQFVDGVLWGGLQYKDGPKKFGVRKSLFYYQPDQMPADFYRKDLDWSTWTSWNKAHAERVDRSFNYLHVVAADWVLYRLARNYEGLVTNHPWEWYLTNAYETSAAMVNLAPEYAVFGQMDGDVFLALMADLRREGMKAQADDLEAKMRVRANRWKEEAYPFGSEMPWDSTGQEEVYAWMKYFGFQEKADVTLNAILGYDPAIPHWGYNGSARRYWDFIFAGKHRQIERQLHHYGSSLNAIPVLAEYREHPEDFYLLRVGYGGTMGALSDIDQEGFLAPAFHAFPDLLRPDALSGDDGPNFFGHAWNTATYIVRHPEFGWVAFGGNLHVEGDSVKVTPLDSFRMRVYVASAGVWLTLDAGQFEEIEVNSLTGAVRVGLSPGTEFLRAARLRIEHPAMISRMATYRPAAPLKEERGAYVIPLGKGTTWVDLNAVP